MIKLEGSEEPIETFNLNYDNILLKQILWTKDNKSLIVNIMTTKEDNSKYYHINMINIIEGVPFVKIITPPIEENPQIELIETIETQGKQMLKIKIKKQEEANFRFGWINVETGIFVCDDND